MTGGFTLVELLITVAVIGLMASLGWGGYGDQLARLEVEAAARRLVVGMERGRDAAERTAEGCALELGPEGWRGVEGSDPPACIGADTPLSEGVLPSGLLFGSTFSGPVRFTANGLTIDGGTAVVGHAGTRLVRCVVMSMPLGVTRVGRYGGVVTARPQAGLCLPDPAL
jgi:prepilin-type N-terminal cleavage/methylation domain-containing protein